MRQPAIAGIQKCLFLQSPLQKLIKYSQTPLLLCLKDIQKDFT